MVIVMLMIERTLLLVKPDGVSRALIGKVISTMEDAGLKVVAIKMVLPDKKIAGEHYAADPKWFEDTGGRTLQHYKEKGVKTSETAREIGMRIRSYLISFLMSGPIVAAVVEGNSSIPIVRKLIGSTEPRKADPSTIRGKYSTDTYEMSDKKARPILNLVHASEDKRTAEREIAIWFKKSEILDYKRADESALF
jgi:nucleoside-diphosphate kinase